MKLPFLNRMPDAEESGQRVRSARTTAFVSGVFSLWVGASLVWNSLQLRVANPLDSVQLAQLKKNLEQQPGDESLKLQIRKLDYQLRREFSGRRKMNVNGSYLLLAGLLALLASLKVIENHRRQLPMPQPAARDPEGERGRARLAVSGLSGVLGLLVVWGCLADRPLSGEGAGASGGSDAKASYATADEMKKEWPRFLGPGGAGLSAYTNVPQSWNGKTGQGIVWKAQIPLPGHNSPVVWKESVYVTGATATKREVYCFDTGSGKLRWKGEVKGISGSPTKPPAVMEDTGFAAPTCATDGERVYAIFANGDFAAFSPDGKLLWGKALGIPEVNYGYASSLVTWENLVFVLMDQGYPDEGKSFLRAIDGESGKTVWEKSRPVASSWTTPAVIEVKGKPQLITCSDPWVIAYDPKSGAEVWKAQILSGEIAPSTAFAGGQRADPLLFFIEPYSRVVAVKADGSGDVTHTHVAWEAFDGIPDICTPVTNGELLFLLNTPGSLTCYEANTGKKVWEKELAMDFKSSPCIAGGKLYMLSVSGKMIVVTAGRQFKKLGESELGEECTATPAFLDGRIYLRGEKNLYCIGS
ncbi:MAG: PQQ-binding-like beta-propeller repeat protein [Armatimonadetes bacterium]|nr:PQQ-binding-like beta-propeller repeat protein [Armatimonadota bacterium]